MVEVPPRQTRSVGPNSAMKDPALVDPRSVSDERVEGLRIVQCIDSMSVSGGTELNAFRTAVALRRRGHVVTMFTLTADVDGMSHLYSAAGIPVERFPVRSLVGPSAWKQVTRMAAVLRQSRADVVHAHDLYSNFLVAFASRLARMPFVASRRWTKYIHRRHFWTDSLAYRLADRVLANSRGVGETVHAQQGVARDKIVVVPNFVDSAVFDALKDRDRWRNQFRFRASDFVLAVIAQLREEKNHQLLLTVFAELIRTYPNIKLLIVGDGELRARITEQTHSLGISESVVMAGHISEAWRTIAAADVAMLPSLHEGFPNSLIEAMAVGVPVIASDVGGIRDVVQNDVNGVLVPAGDAAELSRAITSAISHYDVSRQLATRAKRDVAAGFREDSVIDSLETIYGTLCAARKKAVPL